MSEETEGKKKRGRPKGSKNKATAANSLPSKPRKKSQSVIRGIERSRYLLKRLEDYHFDVIEELLERYRLSKSIFMPILLKIRDNIELTPKEEKRLDKFSGEARMILFNFMGYCFPKLRATEIQAGTVDRVTFNIVPQDPTKNENKENDRNDEDKPPAQVIKLIKS